MLKTTALSCAIALASLPAAVAEPLKVVASFSIIGDFAKQVGGERVALTTLVGPGSDAHVYQPSPADTVAVKGAEVVLVNGLHFEGFLDRLIATSETKAQVVDLSRGADTLASGEDEAHSHDGHEHGAIDPHAFQSVANAKIYVSNVAQAFCTADAAGCDSYKANAAAYSQKLDALDAEIRTSLSAVPSERRTIITSHDAFAYFGKAYDISFLAPEGMSTEAEASAADMAALIRQVREAKASAIFVENISNPKLIEQIAAETGLTLGGTLYSDALTEGPPADSYIDLMRANALTIAKAASGS